MVMDGDGSWGQVCLASRHCSSLTYCRYPGIEIVEGVEKEMKGVINVICCRWDLPTTRLGVGGGRPGGRGGAGPGGTLLGAQAPPQEGNSFKNY